VNKPEARKIDVNPDWAAFTLTDPLFNRFLVGYGLGWQGQYRALPYVGTIPPPPPDPAPGG
jgi:hypoxanthine phosphoribosyltransferase